MDKFEEYFRTTERYQDCLCWGSDKWIFKSVDGRYLSEEIQRMYELWQHQQAKVDELQKRVDAGLAICKEQRGLVDPFNNDVNVAISDLVDELEQALKGGNND